MYTHKVTRQVTWNQEKQNAPDSLHPTPNSLLPLISSANAPGAACQKKSKKSKFKIKIKFNRKHFNLITRIESTKKAFKMTKLWHFKCQLPIKIIQLLI